MPERHRRRKGNERSFKVDAAGRRRFIKASAVGVGVLAAFPVIKYIRDATYNGEGDEDFPLAGERVVGGEIVEDSDLAYLYKEALDSGRPLEPDPTIIRSTLHNAMHFFGTRRHLAERRCQNVTLSNGHEGLMGCGGGAACVYDTTDGLGVEITPSLFVSGDVQFGWLDLLQALSHEAYHLSVKAVDDRPRVEDFGVLGKYNLIEDIRGFWRSEDYQGQVGDLANRLVATGGGRPILTSMAEEFFAEVGRERYLKHLMPLGLDESDSMSGVGYPTPYTFFRQGVIDVQDVQGVGGNLSWQDWWGGALDPEKVDRLHYHSDRTGLFEGLGERILYLNRNPRSVSLSRENTTALGLIAFNDFIDYDLSHHEILFSLTERPIDAEAVIAYANTLAGRISEVYILP
jgi:hypothetical protein